MQQLGSAIDPTGEHDGSEDFHLSEVHCICPLAVNPSLTVALFFSVAVIVKTIFNFNKYLRVLRLQGDQEMRHVRL